MLISVQLPPQVLVCDSFNSVDTLQESAKFLLLLYQQHHLSHAAVSDVIKGYQHQCQSITSHASSIIAERLTEIGLDPETITEICSVQNVVPQPFSGLETN